MKGRGLNLFVIIAMLVVALGITGAAFAAPSEMPSATQDTCPDGGGWVKIDGLSGTSYTYNAPEGYVIVEWCYKAATTVNSGVVDPPQTSYTVTSTVTNQNDQIQELSHASFKLQEAPPDPATVSVSPGTCEWDGEESLTTITVTITGSATVTITGPGGPYVFNSSGSVDVGPGSYSWSAVAGEGYEIEGPSSGEFSTDDCEPEEDPATVSVSPGTCEWDGEVSTTPVTVTITGNATVTITGPGGPYVFNSSGSVDVGPGSYSWSAVAGEGYYIQGDDSGEFNTLSCAPGEASVSLELSACYYRDGKSQYLLSVTIVGDVTLTIEGPGGPYAFTENGEVILSDGSYSWSAVAGEGYQLVGDSSGEFSISGCKPPVKEPPTGPGDMNLLPVAGLGIALVLVGAGFKLAFSRKQAL